jgi:hypothetical protein
MKTLGIPIIRKTYLLYGSFHALTPAIPKLARHTLWQRVLTTTLTLLEGLLSVGHTPIDQKPEQLRKQSNSLELLRILIRLCFDTKLISQKQYLATQEALDEIGRMIGGWLKSIPKTK